MASVDYFLKIDGIDGESTDPKQKGSISILSWTWGATQASVNATAGSNKPQTKVHDLEVTAPISTATTRLFMACAAGDTFKTAELTCRKAGKEQLVFYKIHMSDVMVRSVRLRGGKAGEDPGGLPPLEEVTLSFAKVEMEYKAQKEDGSVGAPVKGGWDLKKNAKS